MTNLQITKEYNEASSNHNNMDVFDIYVNDWGLLQYGFRYNELHGLYEIHFMTTGKKFTGLTLEKMNRIIKRELDYRIELFRKHNRI